MLMARKLNNLKPFLVLQKGNNTVLYIHNEWDKK